MIVPNVIYVQKPSKLWLKPIKNLSEEDIELNYFDCYRPLDIRKKDVENCLVLYMLLTTKGSIHNRGAVDITLVDAGGKNLIWELFLIILAIENLHDYPNLSETVRKTGSYSSVMWIASLTPLILNGGTII
jgi:hypothetical protein